MGFSEFIQKSRRRYERRGATELPVITKDFVASSASRIPPLRDWGVRIYEGGWDVLVILDACRADMYRRIVNEKAGSVWSCASQSDEWIEKNFNLHYEGETLNTAYITGNVFSKDLSEDDFALLDEVWRYGWDEELGTVPPRPITDRAIRVNRSQSFERVIIHYMQPHIPFIGGDEPIGSMDLDYFGAEREAKDGNLWEEAMLGKWDKAVLWEAYDENLRYVWEDVQLLLNNISGKAVITADHGNALGEWGMWGHRRGIPIRAMREVPWDTYQCTDSEDYEPSTYDRRSDEDSVDERLRALGYV